LKSGQEVGVETVTLGVLEADDEIEDDVDALLELIADETDVDMKDTRLEVSLEMKYIEELLAWLDIVDVLDATREDDELDDSWDERLNDELLISLTMDELMVDAIEAFELDNVTGMRLEAVLDSVDKAAKDAELEVVKEDTLDEPSQEAKLRDGVDVETVRVWLCDPLDDVSRSDDTLFVLRSRNDVVLDGMPDGNFDVLRGSYWTLLPRSDRDENQDAVPKCACSREEDKSSA
jgi:hypothetical protein